LIVVSMNHSMVCGLIPIGIRIPQKHERGE
jgi:hypothetical protein